MKSLPARTVIKILQKHGFVLARRKGSHMIFKDSNCGIMVPMPLHGGNKPIPLGTFLAIVKQSKIPKADFHL